MYQIFIINVENDKVMFIEMIFFSFFNSTLKLMYEGMDYIHVILAVGRHQVILLSAHKLFMWSFTRTKWKELWGSKIILYVYFIIS